MHLRLTICNSLTGLEVSIDLDQDLFGATPEERFSEQIDIARTAELLAEGRLKELIDQDVIRAQTGELLKLLNATERRRCELQTTIGVLLARIEDEAQSSGNLRSRLDELSKRIGRLENATTAASESRPRRKRVA